MTGRIQYMLSPILPALPFLRDGKLLPLAVTTSRRSLLLADVPTIAESGIPDFEYQDWWGVFAPSATPTDVIDKISKEIRRVLELPDIANQLLDQGAEVWSSTPDDFSRFVRTKITEARQVALSANIRAD